MKLWELRSYDQVIKLEQERLVYQARLRSRFGRAWRRKAPVESLMPLRLARYGVPLAETAPAGLAAAGIEPALLPPVPATSPQQPELPRARDPHHDSGPRDEQPQPQHAPRPHPETGPGPEPEPEILPHESPWFARHPASYAPEEPYDQWYEEQAPYDDGQHADQRVAEPEQGREPGSGPGSEREPGRAPGPQSQPQPQAQAQVQPQQQPQQPESEAAPDIPGLPEDVTREEAYFAAFRKYVSEHGEYPNARQFGLYLMDLYGVTGQAGGPLTESTLRPYLHDFRGRYQQDLDAEAEYIA